MISLLLILLFISVPLVDLEGLAKGLSQERDPLLALRGPLSATTLFISKLLPDPAHALEYAFSEGTQVLQVVRFVVPITEPPQDIWFTSVL